MNLESNQSVPFLNTIPLYISNLIDKFISKIPYTIRDFIVRAIDFSNLLIGGLLLYVPFVYLFHRDCDLEENVLNFGI